MHVLLKVVTCHFFHLFFLILNLGYAFVDSWQNKPEWPQQLTGRKR